MTWFITLTDKGERLDFSHFSGTYKFEEFSHSIEEKCFRRSADHRIQF